MKLVQLIVESSTWRYSINKTLCNMCVLCGLHDALFNPHPTRFTTRPYSEAQNVYAESSVYSDSLKLVY